MGFRSLAKYEVVKHIGAVHISNPLSLLERKISNVLLRNAWENLLDQDVHTISIRALGDAAGFDSKNVGALKASLSSLVETTVTWNILSRDRKNVWGKSSILASVQIIDGTGICEYSYPPHLRNLLRNPNIFARLNLLIQRQFDSKYSLAMWEYASGELALAGLEDEGMGQGHMTDWIAVEALRHILGSENPAYAEYRVFNREVLRPAIAEVNRVSNLAITDTEARREKRKITALRFAITTKDTYQLPLDFDVPALLEDEPAHLLPLNVNEEKADLIRRMIEVGVDEKAARGIARAYGAERITENLEWAVAQIESGRGIRRPGAFVASAIRNDYVEPERVKRKKTRQLRVDRERQQRDKKELEALVEKVEGDFWLHRVSRVDAVLTTYSAEQREAFERLLEEHNVFLTEKRWEEYRKNGLAGRPERTLFYHFAFRELLPPEDSDAVRFATGQGMAEDVVAALLAKKENNIVTALK